MMVRVVDKMHHYFDRSKPKIVCKQAHTFQPVLPVFVEVPNHETYPGYETQKTNGIKYMKLVAMLDAGSDVFMYC